MLQSFQSHDLIFQIPILLCPFSIGQLKLQNVPRKISPTKLNKSLSPILAKKLNFLRPQKRLQMLILILLPIRNFANLRHMR